MLLFTLRICSRKVNLQKHKHRHSATDCLAVFYFMGNIIDLKGEVWKDIVAEGLTGRYQISNFGRIKSMYGRWDNGPEIIKPTKLTNGYFMVVMYYGNGKGYTRLYHHRVIAIAFIPNPENKPCINHINNNRGDNRIENLEWCTKQENSSHAKNQNRISRGTHRHCSKLKEEDVVHIFTSEEKAKDLAKLFSVNEEAIYDIRKGRSWAWLTNKIP